MPSKPCLMNANNFWHFLFAFFISLSSIDTFFFSLFLASGKLPTACTYARTEQPFSPFVPVQLSVDTSRDDKVRPWCGGIVGAVSFYSRRRIRRSGGRRREKPGTCKQWSVTAGLLERMVQINVSAPLRQSSRNLFLSLSLFNMQWLDIPTLLLLPLLLPFLSLSGLCVKSSYFPTLSSTVFKFNFHCRRLNQIKNMRHRF